MLAVKFCDFYEKIAISDFVSMIECENGSRDTTARGDGGKSYGLCQLNTRRHKEPLSDEWNDRRHQLSVCYQKRKGGTKFYGPQRMIGGRKCGEVANKRFYFVADYMMAKEKPKIDYLKIHDNGYVAGYTTNTKFFEFYKTDIAKAFETYGGSFVKSLGIALYHADDINTILLLKTRKHYVKEYIEDFILSEYLECNP